MYIDAQALLSDAQAFSSDAVTTNAYDTGSADNNLGTGEPLGVFIQVDVAADFTTGDETYQFNFIQSSNANLSSADILCSIVRTAAQLTAGSTHVLPIPAGAITKRYLGVAFDGGGTTPTITATIFIQPLSMIQQDKNYPDGITIS